MIRSIGLAFLVLFVAASFGSIASAADKTTDPVQIYCTRVMPKKAASACAGTNNIYITQVRNAATYHCTNVPIAGGKKADCIESQSKLILRAVADKKPTSVKSFKSKINSVLTSDTRATGGSITTPSPDSLAIRDPGSLAAPKTDISAGSLPKPPTDTTTITSLMSFIFALLGAISLLMITVMGLKYMFAAGDPNATAEARKGIIYALVGLVIAVSAESIVVFLVNNVLK